MRRLLLALGLGLGLLLAGCGHGPRVSPGPATPQPLLYQRAWVDPVIVVSDSLYSLIRAARVDSFMVEHQSDLEHFEDASLEFRVDGPACFVSVNVLDEQGRILRPLIARNLPTGFYKVTVNLEQFDRTESPFLLKAAYCEQTATTLLAPFIRRR